MHIDENFDKSSGCFIENNPNMFIHIKDTLPKLKWLYLKRSDSKKSDRWQSVAWNYYFHSMKSKMLKTANLLWETYLPWETEKNLDYYTMWNGTDTGSCEWHHDTEGGNLQFNLYFTDSEPNNGGEIMYRNMKENKRITTFHLPKKYDIVMGSVGDDLKFQHRVEHTKELKQERITMLFRFKVKESPWK